MNTEDCPYQQDYYLVGRECYDCDDNPAPVEKCLKRYDCEYKRVGKKLVNEGTWIKNKRTGKNCLTMIGDMMKFDLRDTDQFPILTTKKMNIKPVIGELLGFIRGYDNAADFRTLNCKIWDANANDNEQWLNNPNRKGEDDLGRIYGVQARSRNTFFKIENRLYEKPVKQKLELPDFGDVVLDDSMNESNLLGKVFTSKTSGQFRIIKERRSQTSHYLFDIIFLDTGYIKRNVQHSAIRSLQVKDPYYPNVCGIAAYGIPKDEKLAKLLSPTWRDMIHRCYGEKRMNSPWYKDNDVFVEDRWLLFENFVEDFKKLDRWELKLEFPEKYSLDKDFYCSNMYSVNTCIWSSKQEQNINSRQGKQFLAISPDGEFHYEEIGISNFCEKIGLNRRSVEMALASGAKNKGWEFKQINNLDSNIRIRIDDQLAHAIAKIKHNPSDRRIIVDHWNPNELHMMALPPCHMNYSFSVQNDTLHLTLYQRSCDYPIGIPFNIASYALLLKIVAKITGLKAGTFTHFMSNIHIYEDQYELFLEQLKRDVKPSPVLNMPEISSLKDLEEWVTPNDFTISDYDPDPLIKYPFSV